MAACELLERILGAICHPMPRVIFDIRVGEQSGGPIAKTPNFKGPTPKKGYLVMLQTITDSQWVAAKPRFIDKKKNPAPVQNPVWSTDNTEVVALEVGTVNDDGTFTPDESGPHCKISAVGPLGTANITLKGDADPGDGEVDLFGTATVQVTAGQATSIELELTEPKEQDEPVPPPVI